MTGCEYENIVNNWVGAHHNLDRWFRLERYMAIGDLGVANGYSYAAADLEMAGEIRGLFHTCQSTFDLWSLGHYFRQDNGALLRVYISEIYVDVTAARIELGDAPNWDDCTHREIQIPQAWDQVSASFEVNTGNFNSGQDVFVFLVDEDGVPSNGFPVTIGEAHVPTDPGPPGPPGQPRHQP
jgi:hypothetical protein